ncbi:MAG TPA: VOC family protein [Bryobacteraceae bacterium]|nr:VOC family protein [Bryobacteraceae bacterium]
MKLLTLLAILLPAAAWLPAQTAPARPKILGIAHMAIYVRDLAKTRQFYEDFLGFAEPFTLPQRDGSPGVRIAFVKVNDRQYIEIFTEPDRGEGQLNHISIYTDDAERMRDYLLAKGIAPMGNASMGPVPKGQTGNKNFNVKDPDGHIVEIVEYQPDSWTAQHAGKDMPSTRVAESIMHLGFLVDDLAKSAQFYAGILGFQETWRGTSNPNWLSWVNLRVPDGKDYVEFMLYDKLPEPGSRGTKNHMSLMVPDAQKALEILKQRAARGLYQPSDGKPMAIQVGVNRKRQINLYDPDGTRIELMEPDTVDGQPAPNSTAPPPTHH